MRLKNSLFHIILIISTLFMGVSCVHERFEGPDATEQAQISVLTRNVNDGDGNLDERVVTLRMMIFSGSGGNSQIVTNVLENLSIGTSQFTHTINTGTRTIVFVANETAAVTTQLESVSRLSDLNSVTFSSTAFASDTPIPMSVIYSDVIISKDNNTGQAIISGGGTMINNVWRIELVKLAIKLDITLTSEDDLTSNFNGVILSNLPSYVPLMPSVMYDNSSVAGSNVTFPSSDFTISYSAQAGWQAKSKTDTRIILPSKVFASVNQVTDLTHAVVLTANMNVGSSPSGPIGAAIPNDYTLPRNNNYVVTAKVQFPMPINVDVMDWDSQSIENGIGRSLQLSAVSVNITERVRARVTFTSNQKFVYVDPASVNIADFDGISGSTGNTNFHYTYNTATGLGSGYIDIYSGTLSATKTSTILITANGTGSGVGLSRLLTINFTKTDSGTNVYDEFVGAFWRSNQRGERIIYNPSSTTNSWKAEVEDPTGAGSFVKLSKTFSYDPNLFTDRASDAEQFQVTDGVSTVTGTGRIYFRIGLTSYGSPTTPRYARVKVTPNISQPGTVRYIYLRQGEAADYLMRPIEGNTNLVVRDFAVKFSPYNMTAPVMSPGGVDVASHPSVDSNGGAFAQYPSQAGAFVNWVNGATSNIRKTYHPLNSSGALTGWSFTNPSPTVIPPGLQAYWGALSGYDICPVGYRRPENGDTYSAVTASDPETSEMLQSLWTNPTATGNTENSLYGYLADGFFDRRLPSVSFNNTEMSAVSANNKDVAYVGRLFYNPETNASLFFPLAGSRNVSGGSLANVGSIGSYWTSSSSTLTNAWNFQLGKTTAVPNNATSRGFGYSLRCVADHSLNILSFADAGAFGQPGILAEKQMFINDRTINFGPLGTYPNIDNVRYFYGQNNPIQYAQIANFEGLLIMAYASFLSVTDAQLDAIADRIIAGKLAVIYQVDGQSGAPSSGGAIINPYGVDVRIMARLLGKSSSTFNQIFNPNDSPITTINTFPITANSGTHRIVNGPFGTVPYSSIVTMNSANSYPLAMAAGVQESDYPDLVVLARKNLSDTKDNIMIAAHRKYPFVLMRNGCTLGENEGFSTLNKQLLRPLWLNFAVWSYEYKKSMGL